MKLRKPRAYRKGRIEIIPMIDVIIGVVPPVEGSDTRLTKIHSRTQVLCENLWAQMRMSSQ